MAVKKRFPYRAALVACNGGCRAVKGEKGCTDGCIGCGDCVQACKFGAIFLNEYGVAEVDEEKCIACGKCAKVCQMEVNPADNPNSAECIRCGRCKKACPTQAIECGIKRK